LVGDSNKNTIIKNLFKLANAVKDGIRVVWLEEIDFIAGIKEKSQDTLYTLLSEMD